MYQFLKQIVRQLIPPKMLRRYERGLRQLAAWPYRGSRYVCTVCDFSLSRFVALPTGDLLCPRCGSLPRTRRLWQILDQRIGLSGKRVLHFSPPRCLTDRLGKTDVGDYVTTDYAGEFTADKRLDITSIAEADATYDLIVCYHVLEHVEQDQQAMRELCRILRPGGQCLIQTPFKDGAIYENPAVTTPEERLIHFGQDDHVRIYSVAGLQERLTKAGFAVEVLTFTEAPDNRHGFKAKEQVLLAQKSRKFYYRN